MVQEGARLASLISTALSILNVLQNPYGKRKSVGCEEPRTGVSIRKYYIKYIFLMICTHSGNRCPQRCTNCSDRENNCSCSPRCCNLAWHNSAVPSTQPCIRRRMSDNIPLFVLSWDCSATSVAQLHNQSFPTIKTMLFGSQQPKVPAASFSSLWVFWFLKLHVDGSHLTFLSFFNNSSHCVSSVYHRAWQTRLHTGWDEIFNVEIIPFLSTVAALSVSRYDG